MFVDGVLALVHEGYGEQEVLTMPLNKAFLLLEAAARRKANYRRETVVDLVASISSCFSGKGLKEYLASLGD